MTELYLDWNATTPPHPRVIEAMAEAARTSWGNPSSVHAAGRRARQAIETLRERIADALSVEPRRVVLVSGGTEANNLALGGARALITSRLEHPSVTRVAEALERRGRVVRWLPVPANGRLEPSSLAPLARELPAGSWLAVQAANHETGVLQPLGEFGAAARALGLLLHVDAAQALGKISLDEVRLADSISLSAHKIRGPKGIGALVFSEASRPEPLLHGGSQERGLRPGTPDPVLAAGFLAALELAGDGPERWALIAPLRDALEAELGRHGKVNGGEPRLPHVSNLSFEQSRGEVLVAALDLVGIRVSSGSACSAGSAEPSAVITAMLGVERARSAVRLSVGEDFSASAIWRVVEAFGQALRPAIEEHFAR